MQHDVKHDEHDQRFYIEAEGYTSELKYLKLNETTLDFKSTFVPVQLRGSGIAAELVKYGIEFAQKNGYKIFPTCSYVKTYFEKHPQYSEMLVNL